MRADAVLDLGVLWAVAVAWQARIDRLVCLPGIHRHLGRDLHGWVDDNPSASAGDEGTATVVAVQAGRELGEAGVVIAPVHSLASPPPCGCFSIPRARPAYCSATWEFTIRPKTGSADESKSANEIDRQLRAG